jgi:hypothetical protein
VSGPEPGCLMGMPASELVQGASCGVCSARVTMYGRRVPFVVGTSCPWAREMSAVEVSGTAVVEQDEP